jgi:hypothetical protein
MVASSATRYEDTLHDVLAVEAHYSGAEQLDAQQHDGARYKRIAEPLARSGSLRQAHGQERPDYS